MVFNSIHSIILIQNKDFRVFPELYHELLNEIEKEKVFKTVLEWLEKQLAVFKHLAKAGEGGEFESLVLDCPLFTQKVVLDQVDIIEENKNTARVLIQKTHLVKK